VLGIDIFYSKIKSVFNFIWQFALTRLPVTNTLSVMSESMKRYHICFIYAVLILSTLLVFWQVRNFDFVYDDSDYVVKNPHVLTGLTEDGIIWAFTAGHAANWHPLTWLSHMLDCQLFGPDPGWMHLVNVLLHLANTLLLFAVLRKMTGSLWPSAFVAAAFALHPMHIESVAWIAERKDVLSTFFLLLTLAAYVSYVRRRSLAGYLLTVLLFAFGLMAKPMLVTLPFVLLLLDYWPLNRFGWQAGKPVPIDERRANLHMIMMEKIPFFVLAGTSGAITFLVQRAGGAVMNMRVLPLEDRVANAFLSYARYTGKMFWPQDLAAFYPFDAGRFEFWQIVMSVLLLLVISILVIHFGRNRRYLPVGWFWFVVTLVPVIGFVQVGKQALADRYTYIPYIGLFIVIAWGLPELVSKWLYRKAVLSLSVVIVLAVLGICAHRQAGYWRNGVALFSHAIEVTHNNDVAHNNRGAAYYDLGRWQEVIEDCREAVRIDPDYTAAYKNLGFAYGKLGRWEEAMENFKQAIRTKPNYAEAHNNLGFAYGKRGHWQEAIEAFGQAIKLNPGYSEAHCNLGVAYYSLGRYRDAMDAHKEAIKADPGYAEAYSNLGNVYSRLGRWQEAIDSYKQAIEASPDYIEAYNNLAWLIATNPDIQNRDPNEAIRIADHACELVIRDDPALPVLMGTLAAAYASAGRFGEAIDTANRAVNLADAANQPQVKKIIQYHLSFYTHGKPYIEPRRESPIDPNRL
jgi:tetratricopeptide (TPR) repeat protein